MAERSLPMFPDEGDDTVYGYMCKVDFECEIAAPHHGRRCLTADELREKGWRVKPSGGWTPEMPYELVRSATGATIGAGVGMGSGSGRSSRGGPLGRLP